MSYSRHTDSCTPIDYNLAQIKKILSAKKINDNNLPLYLVSFYLIFTHLFKSENSQHNPNSRYPISTNRYSSYGWNANYQHCYTSDDIALMQRIRSTYHEILDDTNTTYFNLYIDKRWYDWWECSQPSYLALLRKFDSDSFTLPNRESKDSKYFPLWNLADNMARQIANWQGQRIKNQPISRINDPVMHIFEEYRDWFFNDLSKSECKNEVLNTISKRLGHVKNLIHLIPHFGPDRFHLLEIQHSLDDSYKIITNCIANKELPQYLSDIIITSTSLETTIGSYLHFLLSNEEVADNFSPEHLDDGQRNCHLSPICKIHKTHKSTSSPYGLSKFYSLVKSNDHYDQLKMKLKPNSMDSIKFASFVNLHDKENYLEAIATLDALVQTRKVLEQFNDIQSKLGNYVFAVYYQDSAHQLSSHYIKLVNKIKFLTKSLLKTADDGLRMILINQKDKHHDNELFEKNLRTLETKLAHGITPSKQLEDQCTNTILSIVKYQQVMQKLVSDVQSGKAHRELELAMKDILLQINYMNKILPSLLGETLLSTHPDPSILIQCDTHGDHLCNIQMLERPIVKYDPIKTNSSHTQNNSTKMIDGKDNLHILSLNLIENITDQVGSLCETVINDGQAPHHLAFDYGKWDETTKIDRHTQEPIYTYRVYQGDIENGYAEFYGSPVLCQTEDGRHNIIKTTGVLSEFHITPDMSVDDVCAILPPTTFDRILYSASDAAFNGALLGSTRVIGVTMQSRGYSKRVADITSQILYYGTVFTMRFHDYYNQRQEQNETTDYFNAFYYAAIDTGMTFLSHFALGQLTKLMQLTGDYIANTYHASIGKGIKQASGLLRFGIYAQRVTEHGLIEGSTAILSGMVAEVATEQMGQYALSLKNS